MDKKYQTTFILDTRGYSEPVETLVEKLKGVIESAGCKVEASENLGQKTFARAVDRNFPAGIYVKFDYEGPANSASIIREKLKLDKTVNRFIVVAK